jgi:hypothetical protein
MYSAPTEAQGMSEDGDLAAVDDEGALLGIHGAGELAVNRVILEHVSHVLGVHEGVVQSDDLNIVMSQGSAESETADAAKAIDTNLREHGKTPFNIEKTLKD